MLENVPFYSALEESVWKSLVQAMFAMPAYSRLSRCVSNHILDPRPGGDILIRTLFAVPMLFDIGPFVSKDKIRVCFFDVQERTFGGACNMDSVCGDRRMVPADNVVKSLDAAAVYHTDG
jgi:hypothetical protein